MGDGKPFSRRDESHEVLLDLLRIAGVERDTNFIDLVIDDCFDLFLVGSRLHRH